MINEENWDCWRRTAPIICNGSMLIIKILRHDVEWWAKSLGAKTKWWTLQVTQPWKMHINWRMWIDRETRGWFLRSLVGLWGYHSFPKQEVGESNHHPTKGWFFFFLFVVLINMLAITLPHHSTNATHPPPSIHPLFVRPTRNARIVSHRLNIEKPVKRNHG